MKIVEGFEDYSITKEGRIYSTHRSGQFLKPAINGVGYQMVTLCKNRKRFNVNVHRLVARAYVENKSPEKYKQVNHLDGNRANCHYSNLEWTDGSGNIKHAYKYLSKRPGNEKLTNQQIVQIREINDRPQWAIAKMFNVCQATISKIKLGKSYQHIL